MRKKLTLEENNILQVFWFRHVQIITYKGFAKYFFDRQ